MPRGLLELVDVLERGEVARHELADVGDHRYPRPRAPAQDRHQRGDREHPARGRDREGEGAARPPPVHREPRTARLRAAARPARREHDRPGRGLPVGRFSSEQGRKAHGERQREGDHDPDHQQDARSRAPSGSATAPGRRNPPRWPGRRLRSRGRPWRRPPPPHEAARSPPGPPLRSEPGTGSRSRRRARSAPAALRSRPSSASRRPATGSRTRCRPRRSRSPAAAA